VTSRDDDQPTERVVIRDKRRIDPTGGKVKSAADEKEKPAETPEKSERGTGKEHKPSHAAPDEPVEGEIVEADETTESTEPAADAEEGAGPLGAELEALRSELEERTNDLQRVTAEYANYRKRVDRDRCLAAEQVLSPRCPSSWSRRWGSSGSRRSVRRATPSTRRGTRPSPTRPPRRSVSRPVYRSCAGATCSVTACCVRLL
jgi:hypothetical protein